MIEIPTGDNMLEKKLSRFLFLLPVMAVMLSLVWYFFIYAGSFKALWITADQEGYQHYKKGEFLQSAQAFEDPAFKGSAFYRAGEFKKAAAVFATLSDENSRYNLANAYLMQGKYKEAIEFYDLALKIKPDFTQAKENKAIAMARQARLDQNQDNDEGTGGQMEADEIVYDNKNQRGQEVEEQGATNTSNMTHWLDRLQTGPKQFLQHKFGYQYANQKTPEP
jgi:Ca-activated chloride channel family protein